MRGDFEAQRHWIALTSSGLGNWRFLQQPPWPTPPLRSAQWYFHDLAYWGLDYPPLTAYHSMFLGFCARLARNTARFVTLRPPADSSAPVLEAWDAYMTALEVEGALKVWMRATVVIGDLLIYLSAVVRYCTRTCRVHGSGDVGGSAGSRSSSRVQRRIVSPRRDCTFISECGETEQNVEQLSAVLVIGLQPSLILIDNGHFQYVSFGLAVHAMLPFRVC